MNKKEKLPTKKQALELLKDLEVSYPVRRHSVKVAEKALEIASKITKADIDLDLVEIGGLLHDIGRAETHGFNHALIGGEIIRNQGFSEKLARICQTHILGGLDHEDSKSIQLPDGDYVPKTLEEKIVCMADKLTSGSHYVTIEQRFEKWFGKYGKTKILMKSRKRILKIKKELQELMNNSNS